MTLGADAQSESAHKRRARASRPAPCSSRLTSAAHARVDALLVSMQSASNAAGVPRVVIAGFSRPIGP
jgi:hypothetical protein